MIRHSKMKNGRMMKMKKRMSKIGCISTFPQMVVNRNNWCCLVQASMTSTTDTFGYIRKYIPVDRSSFLVWELTNTPSQTAMIAWHLAESNMYLFDINNKYLFIKYVHSMLLGSNQYSFTYYWFSIEESIFPRTCNSFIHPGYFTYRLASNFSTTLCMSYFLVIVE